MQRFVLFLTISMLFTACSMTPKPYTENQRYAQAEQDLKRLFAHQDPVPKKIDFYQALGRGLKYNLDYRIKLANTALQMGQLRVAEYAMLPALNTSGSLYTRNNDLASFSTTTTGSPTDVLSSTPRTLRSARSAISWNVFDFGLSYVKAKQQNDRVLIAEEEARKQLQQLAQDILTSYWDAYSAQELMKQTHEFQGHLMQAKRKLELAMQDKVIPKENILRYQEALLEGNRHLIQLQFKYDKAVFDLKHLLNIPLNMKLNLAAPPSALLTAQDLSRLNFKKLDAIALVKRPELWSQSYQRRIAKWGVKATILQALPGLTFNYGWNYNSNKFLLNKEWVDRSMDIAWNLLNVASLPAAYHSSNDQAKYEKLKLTALTLAVLTETRYAYSHYQNLRNEYFVARAQTDNAEAQYDLARHRAMASLGSNQQVILAKIHALAAKMDENILLSDLSTALGELYLSVGFDMIPPGINNEPLPKVVKILKRNFVARNNLDFNHYVETTYARMFNQHAKA